MGQTVKGTANKGFRNTHGNKPIPSNAPPENSVPGAHGEGGAENVKGNAGNGSKGSI